MPCTYQCNGLSNFKVVFEETVLFFFPKLCIKVIGSRKIRVIHFHSKFPSLLAHTVATLFFQDKREFCQVLNACKIK